MKQKRNIIADILTEVFISGLRAEANRYRDIAQDEAEEAFDDRDLGGFIISNAKIGACDFIDGLLEEEQRRRQKERRKYLTN